MTKEKQEDIRFHVVDDYYISSDGTRNYLLVKRMVVTKNDSENLGNEYYTVEGYYGKLEHLYKAISEKIVMSNIDVLVMKNIGTILSKLDTAETNIKIAVKDLATLKGVD